jgi:hypothetical protein
MPEFAGILRKIPSNSGIDGAGNGAGIAWGVPDSQAESLEFWHLQESHSGYLHSGILAFWHILT